MTITDTTVLAFESSCDETAVAVLRQKNATTQILAEHVHSQIADHADFGGVVPEIAARAHLHKFPEIIASSLKQAQLRLEDIDVIASTTGPGLIGGLLVGSMIARSMALRWQKPFYGIHHLEGHLLSPRLNHTKPQFPYLVLLASGGHTMIVLAKDVGDYSILGRSRDDALGEAFDKSAIIMGLPYPGGPELERLAVDGDSVRYPLPSPLVGARDRETRLSCDFSFSGLKTAVARQWKNLSDNIAENDIPQARCDMAASFHLAVQKILINRVKNAIDQFKEFYPDFSAPIPIVFVGGVAANTILRNALNESCAALGAELSSVPLSLCTDNATMIAWAAIERINKNIQPNNNHQAVRPRWSLEDL